MRSFPIFFTALLVLFSLSVMTLAQSKGFDTSRMDTSVDACNDFYQYANGNWLKTTKIPAEYPSWGSFLVVYENNQNVLKQIVENDAKTTNAAKGSAAPTKQEAAAPLMADPKLVQTILTNRDVMEAIRKSAVQPQH